MLLAGRLAMYDVSLFASLGPRALAADGSDSAEGRIHGIGHVSQRGSSACHVAVERDGRGMDAAAWMPLSAVETVVGGEATRFAFLKLHDACRQTSKGRAACSGQHTERTDVLH